MRTLTEQRAALAAGEVSAVELVERALTALERCSERTNAFTTVLAEQALDQARAPRPGPLSGIPIAVKDLFDLAGAPTSGCTRPYHGRVAATDSAVVARLRAAGAIIIAKTNQHELAAGATGIVSSYGPVRNPWDPERIPGGSSSGSAAAVAAGVVGAAIGSDTGGSIRMPASFCGLTGLKPTHGAVSLAGAMPLCPELDTAGPIAATAEDCALVHDVLADRSVAVAPFAGEQHRVGLPRPFLARLDPQVRGAVADAARTFEGLGATIVELDGPEPDDDMVGFNIVWARFAELYPDLVGDERVSPEVGFLLSFGDRLSAEDHARAHERLAEIRAGFARAFEQVDLLLAPTTPFPAPRATEEEVAVEGGSLAVRLGGPALRTRPANEAGVPALALPAGWTPDGLPLSVQLIGPAWSEGLLLGAGVAFQAATDHVRPPAG